MTEISPTVMTIAAVMPVIALGIVFREVNSRTRKLQKVKNEIVGTAYQMAGMLGGMLQAGAFDTMPFSKQEIMTVLANFAELAEARERLVRPEIPR